MRLKLMNENYELLEPSERVKERFMSLIYGVLKKNEFFSEVKEVMLKTISKEDERDSLQIENHETYVTIDYSKHNDFQFVKVHIFNDYNGDFQAIVKIGSLDYPRPNNEYYFYSASNYNELLGALSNHLKVNNTLYEVTNWYIKWDVDYEDNYALIRSMK